MDAKKLKELYMQTSFYEDSVCPEWDGLKFIANMDEDDEEREYPHVGECSYFGETSIVSNNVYEGSGLDCFFIQELVRLYMENKMKVIESSNE